MSLHKEQEELLSKAYEIGYSYEKIFHGCAQCVVTAVMDMIGEADDQVFRSATGLGGGIAMSSRGTCGALIGGIMAISFRYGRERSNFADIERLRTRCHEICRKLFDKFESVYGSNKCGDVQTKLMGRSFHLLDPIEYEEAIKAGAHEQHCPSVVGNVAKWTVEIILRERG